MCGRYSITLPPEAIREIFRTHGELPNWPAYYNAPPTTALPIVRQAKDGDSREPVLMTWGLIPWFSKDGKPSYSTPGRYATEADPPLSLRTTRCQRNQPHVRKMHRCRDTLSTRLSRC